MEHDETSDGPARSGISTHLVEAAVALLLLVLGLVVVFEARKLGAGWTTDGPGAGYFPFFIGVIITVSGAGILYQALLGKNRNTTVFVDSVQLKRVLSVLVPATVYVGAITVLGIYVASALYIALFMVVLGKYAWTKSVLAALGVNTLFFFMFEVWFKVPLFKGAFDPLRFLGY